MNRRRSCWCRSIILAAGALFAGVIFHDAFFGHAAEVMSVECLVQSFWREALFTGPDNHILRRVPPRAAVGEAGRHSSPCWSGFLLAY